MSYRNTAAKDYMVSGYDNGETVTLTTKPAGTTTTITYAVPNELTVDEMMAAGVALVGAKGKRWTLGADQISSGSEPKPGDSITDASSVVWEIKAATQSSLGITWECDCVQNR